MKHYDYMTGYKATDQDMKCQGFQYELGKWYKHEGDVKLCNSGFHFCVHPSGPWAYYNDTGTRVFKIEAKDAYEEYTPGADLKIVCREIRLTEELHPTGYGNTGYGNTGYGNTGDRNTGDGNTGYGNTGYGNTGYGNTGYGNTGYGNATDYSSGFFCQKEPCVISFDRQTKLTRAEYVKKYPNYAELLNKLTNDQPFDYSAFKNMPGWTLKKCKELHQQHINGRKQVTK